MAEVGFDKGYVRGYCDAIRDLEDIARDLQDGSPFGDLKDAIWLMKQLEEEVESE